MENEFINNQEDTDKDNNNQYIKEFQNIYIDFKNSIDKEEAHIWLHDLVLNHARKNKIILVTSSAFKKEKIETSYLPSLEEACASLSPLPAISIQVDATLSMQVGATEGILPSRIAPEPIVPHEMDHKVREDLNFKRFVIAEFNQVAHQFAKKITGQLGQINPLYIYGDVGTGKTHLMHSIGNYYVKNFPFLKIKYINPNDFVSEFTKALSEKKDRQFRLKYRSLDVLLLDDIQLFIGKEKSSVEFFHIFNEIYSPGKQMVFCSDRVPDDLGGIDARLKSRLSSSAIVEIEQPKVDALKKLLVFYAQENDLKLADDVIDFIVAHTPPDIRKVIGIVKTLVVYQDIHRTDITIDLCKQKLRQLKLTEETERFTPEKLLLSISNYAKIPLNDFKSPRRTKTLAFYRQILMYLLRTHTELSLPEIGRFLGGKTNSAILFGFKKISLQMKQDSMLPLMMEKILHGG